MQGNLTAPLIALLIVLSVGVSVFWANPRRLLNQAVTLQAAMVAAWLYGLWELSHFPAKNPVLWLRAIAVLGGCFPWSIWWTGRSVVHPGGRWRDFVVAGKWWALFAVALGALALSEWFIPSASTARNKLHGPGFGLHAAALAGAFLALFWQAHRWLRELHGQERIEARSLLFGGLTACLVAIGVTVAPPLLHLPYLAPYAPFAALGFFGFIAWTIARRRILDARHRLITILRRAVGVVLAYFALQAWISSGWGLSPTEFALGGAVGVVFFLALYEHGSRVLVERLLAEDVAAVVQAAGKLASEVHGAPAGELAATFAPRLAQIVSCDGALLFLRDDTAGALRAFSSTAPGVGRIPLLLADDPWVQQAFRERLAWEIRPVPESSSSGRQEWVVGIPGFRGDELAVLLLLGRKRGRLGLAEEEINALQRLVSALRDTLTTRALAEQEAAQRRLIETGKAAAGIAHNLRSPLAVVRAYLEADPAISAEQLAELHDLALAESSRIQSTIDSLTALSRGEPFALAPHNLEALARRAVEVNASYLAECRATVEIVASPEPPRALAEPWQLTTALTNLLRNSAEEVARGGGGWVRVEIDRAAPGWIELRVRDSGRGLPAHIRDALFSRDLFARTTKPTGAPGRRTGFGIGLHSTMLIVTIGHGGRFAYRDNAFVLTLPAAPSTPRGE